MEFKTINSSNLSRIGYDAKEKKLVVDIKGKHYQYDNVPEVVYTKFINSVSKGKFFHSNIKNQYSCTKL